MEIDKLGGLRNQAPFLNVMFLIILLGSVALPLTSGFVGEYLLFVGLFTYNPYIAGVAGLSIILGAVYMLTMFQKVMLGEAKPEYSNFSHLAISDKIVLIVIVGFILVLGVYPKPFLELSEPSVKVLIELASSKILI